LKQFTSLNWWKRLGSEIRAWWVQATQSGKHVSMSRKDTLKNSNDICGLSIMC